MSKITIDMDGRAQAQARDKWLDSDQGEACRAGTASGQYLENRLHLAFSAGIEAALAHLRQQKKGGKR